MLRVKIESWLIYEENEWNQLNNEIKLIEISID